MMVCLCAALCVVVPQTLRVIPGTDGIYGLIHMPVLLCAFACGIGSGLACTFLGLTVSFFVAEAPSAVMLPVLLAECLAGSVLVGLMKKILPFRKVSGDLSLCFALSILLGRVAGSVLSALLFMEGDLASAFWTGGYFIVSIPGMLIEMVLLPIVAAALVKSGSVGLEVRPEGTKKDEES